MSNEVQIRTEKLLRKKEVAELFSCSTRKIDRMASAGQLTRVRLGESVRFRHSEVQAIMNRGSL